MIDLVVSENEAGNRADAGIASMLRVPRSSVQRALRDGMVTVDGRPVKASYRLELGERVQGEVVVDAPRPPTAEDIPVVVRYSDDRVLVVSKPAGLVVHPASGHGSGTLVNALLGMGGSLSRTDTFRPGIVHRLDKETSGLLIVARDDDAHHSLSAALKARDISREYVALVRGIPASDTGTIDAPVARHPARRRAMAVVPGGRPAVTHFEVLERGQRRALLRVTLETGRTHQIRVHLSHIGHPVLGDRVYGGGGDDAKSLGLTRPFLHARRLVFPHPDDGRRVEVTDPLPEDLIAALGAAAMGRSAELTGDS